MAVEIQLLNGPNTGIQLLGSAMGFGATLSDEEIRELAASLAPRVSTYGSMNSVRLAALLGNYDRDTQQRVGAAIIAAGGSAPIVSAALSQLEDAHAAAGNGYSRKRTWRGVAWSVAATASAAASAFHGYRRNDSLGWGLWWFLMGALFPVVTPAIALAQGFGSPKVR